MKLGWLDPQGNLYECRTYEHVTVAQEIVKKYGYSRFGILHPDVILLEHRWVHITLSQLGTKKLKVYWNNFLTESQKQFLRSYFENSDFPIDAMTLIRWEKENDF